MNPEYAGASSWKLLQLKKKIIPDSGTCPPVGGQVPSGTGQVLESAGRRTSSVRSRTSSAGRRISLISLFSFLLYLIPSFLNYFILGRCHLVLITGHELVVTLLGLVQSFFCTYEVTVPWLAGFNL